MPALAMNYDFNEYQFKSSVAKALKSVESILEATRNPVLPEDTEHTYEDKYALAEFVVNSAIASYTNVLNHIGVKDNVLDQALRWYKDDKSTVELQFVAKTWTEFVKEEERQTTNVEIEKNTIKTTIDNPTTESKIDLIKVKTKVWDVHHTLNIQLDLNVKTKDSTIKIMNHTATVPFIVKTVHQGEKKLPMKTNSSANYMLSLNWLLDMISNDKESQFSIDREETSCKTPRRNVDVQKSLDFSRKLDQFANGVDEFMSRTRMIAEKFLESAVKARSKIDDEDIHIFVPIVALFEKGTVLSMDDLNEFLAQQVQTLQFATANAIDSYSEVDLFSPEQISLGISIRHLKSLPREMEQSLNYVEHLLKNQLFQAIGKHVTANDFDKFMQFHNQRFFGEEYVPKPFSYSVSRAGYYPDGVVSIGTREAGNLVPIETLVRKIPKEELGSPMSIPIDSATTVELEGDVYLHGYMSHVWNGNDSQQQEIIARAQQFSSFLLVIGVMGGSDSFLPKHAIVLQDKDEVVIPLITSMLPSAKAFKDAIASLSPEQQEFARAFRSMQLETSVFGVCVIQLKPQLEKLLQLPKNSLSKEIQLTQDLMSLFIEYQIPSDLLSFDGPENLPSEVKIEAVRVHVGAVLSIIDSQKKAQLQEVKDEFKAEKMMSRPQTQKMMSRPQTRCLYEDAEEEEEIWLTDNDISVDESQLNELWLTDNDISVDASQLNEPKVDGMPQSDPGQTKMSTNTNFDPTMIPKMLDKKLEMNDDGALKSTIVQVGEEWERLRKKNLLVPAQRSFLSNKDKEQEKQKAMDLLTAISRSGSLPIVQSELHIVIAVSHCFQNDVVSTVIQDNINPIQKVEQSMLMLGSVIYEKDDEEMLAPAQK